MSNKILKFGATWCNPCKQSGKFIENKFPDKEYEDFDVTVDVDMAKTHNIKNVPTFILLNEAGEELQRFTGFNPQEITKMFNQI